MINVGGVGLYFVRMIVLNGFEECECDYDGDDE